MITALWTRENLAWLAGILEGEGCFSLSLRRPKGSDQAAIIVQMTDEDTVRRVAEIAGCGTVRGPLPNGRKGCTDAHSPLFQWKISAQRPVYALMAAVYPWLMSRRRCKVEAIMRWYAARPMLGKHAT